MKVTELINLFRELEALEKNYAWNYSLYIMNTFISLECSYPTWKKSKQGGTYWRVWRYDYDKYSDKEIVSNLNKLIKRRKTYHIKNPHK